MDEIENKKKNNNKIVYDMPGPGPVASRVFHKSQNMPCVAVQRMQVVNHYYGHFAKKSEFFAHFPINANHFKICTKNDQINTTKIGQIYKRP